MQKTTYRTMKIVKKVKLTLISVVMHLTNIFIIPFIVRLIKFKNIDLAVTNKRIIGKTGVVNTQVLDAPLNKIQNCAVVQKFAGKIFNYATITITTAAGSYNFHGVKSANAFKNTVMAQIEQYEEDRIKQQSEQMAKAMAGAINK